MKYGGIKTASIKEINSKKTKTKLILTFIPSLAEDLLKTILRRTLKTIIISAKIQLKESYELSKIPAAVFIIRKTIAI